MKPCLTGSGASLSDFQQVSSLQTGDGVDLTQTLFYPSIDEVPGEFLAALPRVRAGKVQSQVNSNPYYDPNNGSESGSPGSSTSIYAAVQTNSEQQFDAKKDVPIIYSDGMSLRPVDSTLNGGADQFTFLRMGYEVPALLIDQRMVPTNAVANPEPTRLKIATTRLLAYLNELVINGRMDSGQFAGLGELTESMQRYIGNPANLDSEVVAQLAFLSVRPRGNGLGAGVDALVGNESLLITLMQSPQGYNGMSGWRFDKRTGMTVYHFMGIPYYRAPVYNQATGVPNVATTSLFAVNFGEDGLRLVMGTGSVESLGIQIDREPVQATRASSAFVVQGAWTLMVGDPRSIYRFDGISVPV